MESWRTIQDCLNYEVSDLGNIRNSKTGRILKTKRRGNQEYRAIGLRSNGSIKTFNIHRLVAQAFIPNPDNLPIVNHISENKTDNRALNLEWSSVKYNYLYSLTRRKKKRYLLLVDRETGEIVQEIDTTRFNYKTIYK